MPQDGEINLEKVKAVYSIPDVVLCDVRELNTANEHRLTSEISLAIGLSLLGAEISSHNLYLLVTCIIFIVFGAFNYMRYLKSSKEILNRTKKDTIG